nr:hypothetical protein [Tanacetum cinerariifolium]
TDDEDEDEEPFEDKDDDDEEEEHLALADSSAIPVVDLVPSAGDTEEFETDESAPTPRSPQTMIPFFSNTSLNVVPEAEMPPRKRACFTTPALGLKIRKSSAAVLLFDREATYARRSWAGSEDMSVAIEAHVKTLEAHVATLIAQTSSLQTQLTTSLGDEPTEAGSSYSTALGPYFSFLGSHCTDHKMAPRKSTARTSPATITTTTTPVTDAQLRTLIAQGVAATLAERNADMSKNVDDNNDSGTDGRRKVSTFHECTYTDLLKCQPMNFKGIKRVISLTQWLEKIESVIQISNCTIACQVKFVTFTLQGNVLTWWKSRVWAVVHDVAHAMPWKTLNKIMTDKYCPRSEIKKLETKMWNLKVKGTDVMSYNQRFQELVLMCDRMFPKESDVVETYVGGLLDMIHKSVKASKPKTIQEAIVFATELMDKKGLPLMNVVTTQNFLFSIVTVSIE